MVRPPSEQMVGAVTNLTEEDSPSFFAHLPLPSNRGATSAHHLFTVLSSNNTFTANIIACVNWQCKTSPQAIDKVCEIQYVQKYFYLLLNDHCPRITKRARNSRKTLKAIPGLHTYLLNTPQPPLLNMLCAGLTAAGLQVISEGITHYPLPHSYSAV